MDTSNLLAQKEYGFLKDDIHLGKHVILLGLAGSYAYGTNNEHSDIDVRGIALNRKSDLLGMTRFEQYVDHDTDTVVYGFHKMLQLLLSCNPNTIELLGLKAEHYLYLNDIGRQLLEHRKLFLSKRAIRSFGGYADQQLRRLQNALARDAYPQQEKEQHILNSVKNAIYNFKSKYTGFDEGGISLYIDISNRPELETEIYMDVNLKHYPLRDYRSIWAEMHNIVKDYEKLGKRNHKKDDNHLNKHAMHLLRLFMMAIDILEQEEIITYREKEHVLLMDIRNGVYQKEDGTYRQEFYEILRDYENRLAYAAEHTGLPENPDEKAVEEFMMAVNEKVVKDEI